MVYTHFILFLQYLFTLYIEDPKIYIEFSIDDNLIKEEEKSYKRNIFYQIENKNVRSLLNELPKIYKSDMSMKIDVLKVDGEDVIFPKRFRCQYKYFPCYEILSDCINSYIINYIR